MVFYDNWVPFPLNIWSSFPATDLFLKCQDFYCQLCMWHWYLTTGTKSNMSKLIMFQCRINLTLFTCSLHWLVITSTQLPKPKILVSFNYFFFHLFWLQILLILYMQRNNESSCLWRVCCASDTNLSIRSVLIHLIFLTTLSFLFHIKKTRIC